MHVRLSCLPLGYFGRVEFGVSAVSLNAGSAPKGLGVTANCRAMGWWSSVHRSTLRGVEPFATIGRELSEQWARVDCDEQRFPALAVEMLERARLHEQLGQRELLRWLAATPTLPRQGELGFGQPPVTLYRDERLYIQALFWLDGTTSIHQHSFSGAFCVLEGSSVHTQYAFNEAQRLNDQVLLGELRMTGIELLAPGQVRAIAPGRQFIHSLFHLDAPTLSLVVRTHHAHAHPVQYTYYRPGVALGPVHRSEGLIRRLEVLETLLDCGHPELQAFCETFVDTADATSLAQLVLRLNVHARGFGLVSAVIERGRKRHPQLMAAMSRVLPAHRSGLLLAARRKAVSDSELRYLLALLLNVPGREQIHAFVRARRPEQSAVQTLLTWLRGLHELKVEGGNALGVDLNADGFGVLKGLLEGKSEAAISEEAARAGCTLSPNQIAQLCFMLPWNSVLGPLLQPSAADSALAE